MIHLKRISPPSELTPQEITRLTNKFISDNTKNVWSQTYIKEQLLKMSHNKCAYCECKIIEESKYLEVEHFFPKKHYPNLVVEWSNLLPSCKRCNGKKGEHDPNVAPIINPAIDFPNEHLIFFNYLIRGKDEKGKNTVAVLNLNDMTRMVSIRATIGTQTVETIEGLLERTENFSNGNDSSVINRSRIINGVCQVLLEAQEEAEYSSTVATILFTSEDFLDLVKTMKKNNLWTLEHENLFNKANENILTNVLQVI